MPHSTDGRGRWHLHVTLDFILPAEFCSQFCSLFSAFILQALVGAPQRPIELLGRCPLFLSLPGLPISRDLGVCLCPVVVSLDACNAVAKLCSFLRQYQKNDGRWRDARSGIPRRPPSLRREETELTRSTFMGCKIGFDCYVIAYVSIFHRTTSKYGVAYQEGRPAQGSCLCVVLSIAELNRHLRVEG